MSAPVAVGGGAVGRPGGAESSTTRAYKSRAGVFLGVPVFLWMGFFFAIPYLLLFLQSFWVPTPFGVDKTWTLHNYEEFFGASELAGNIYLPTLLKSMKVGAFVTIFSTLLAFPIAYLLAFKVKSARKKMMIYTLVVVPLWASYLLRAYAWKIILGQNGLLKDTFLSGLLYSEAAVVIAMTHIFTPFMVLTIYAVLERLPHNLIEASKDLGVGPWKTFTKIVLPLSLPGVIAGGTFTMGLSSGDFVAPMLVGGESNVMIANQIYSQFGATNNWPLGSAIAYMLLFFVAILVWISTAAEKREQI